MTGTQKIIKYCALAFAIFLVVSILSGIVAAVSGIFVLFGDREVAGEMQTHALNQEFDRLTVDIGAGELQIQVGDRFSLETNHQYLEITQKEGHLKLQDTKKVSAAMDYADVMVILTIPADTVFSRASITTGAGTVSIAYLNAEQLDVEFGAGAVDIDVLMVTQSADMQTGAGRVTIGQCSVRDLDLDMGVGQLQISGCLLGNCDLDLGVGKTILTLGGSLEDYAISFEKGLGEAKLEGEVLENGRYGTGANKLNVEGGIGAIEIDFASFSDTNG